MAESDPNQKRNPNPKPEAGQQPSRNGSASSDAPSTPEPSNASQAEVGRPDR